MNRKIILVIFALVMCLQGWADSIYAHFGLPPDGICTTSVPLKLKTPYLEMERIRVMTNTSDGVINSFVLYKVMRPESNVIETLEKETWNLRKRLCDEFKCVSCSDYADRTGDWFVRKYLLIEHNGWSARVSASACSTVYSADRMSVSTNYMVSCRFANEWLNPHPMTIRLSAWSEEKIVHEDPIAKRRYIYKRDEDGHLKKIFLGY